MCQYRAEEQLKTKRRGREPRFHSSTLQPLYIAIAEGLCFRGYFRIGAGSNETVTEVRVREYGYLSLRGKLKGLDGPEFGTSRDTKVSVSICCWTNNKRIKP